MWRGVWLDEMWAFGTWCRVESKLAVQVLRMGYMPRPGSGWRNGRDVSWASGVCMLPNTRLPL